MTIPQTAVDAACEAYRHPKRMITNTSNGAHHDRMTAALEATMPHIRKQIATDIRDDRGGSSAAYWAGIDPPHDGGFKRGYYAAIESAARIVEKGTEK